MCAGVAKVNLLHLCIEEFSVVEKMPDEPTATIKCSEHRPRSGPGNAEQGTTSCPAES